MAMLEPSKKHRIHSERTFVFRLTDTKKWLLISAAFFVLLFLPALSGVLVYYYFGSEERALSQTIETQRVELEELSLQLDYSDQMKANAEVASEVDQQAIEALRQELVSWADKYSQLEEKVNFYQALMDPEPTNSGVFVESVGIETTGEEGRYHYKILIAQRASNHNRVNGSVEVSLISKKNSDGIQTISLKELTGDQDQLTLGFKFFQQFDGSLTLPTGFIPDKLRLVVKIRGSSSTQFEEIVDWVVRS